MRVAASALFALAIACSPDAPEDSTQDRTMPPRMSGMVETPQPDGTTRVRLVMGPIKLLPGEETTQCYTAHLATTEAIDVIQIDARQHFTHHVIFYREDPSATDQPLHLCSPLEINPFVSEKAPLFIGETVDSRLTMPKGVSYRFPAGAPYTMEGHYLNPTTSEVEATAEVFLTIGRKGEQTVPAEMLFYASITALNKSYDGMKAGLPPGQITKIAPPGFRRPKRGIKLFGLTSHQHRMGIDFVISKSTGRSDAGQLLYRNQDWEHPPLLRFPDDQLLTFDESKGEGLRWECTYHNRNDFYLTFGQSAVKNEMCILWGYYYPSQGFDIHFE